MSDNELIDAVYPLGSGSRWEDDELRYSIRSLEKYFPQLRNVYVIGLKPDWYKGIHIPYEENGNRLENVFGKQKLACNHPEISENFLYMNDDFFLLEPFTIAHYYAGTVGDRFGKMKPHQEYFNLSNSNPEWLNFCTHSPFMINKKEWLIIMDGMVPKIPFFPRDYYGNKSTLWERVELPGDSKFRDQTLPELKDFMKDRPFFSAHSGMKRNVFVPFLERLFEGKSKLEM